MLFIMDKSEGKRPTMFGCTITGGWARHARPEHGSLEGNKGQWEDKAEGEGAGPPEASLPTMPSSQKGVLGT